MESSDSDRRRLIVEAGHLLILHPDGPAGGYPLVVPVDHVADGIHWFLGSCAPLVRGDQLIVESPVQHDARYSTSATVVACSPQTFGLRISPLWERLQQRAFVRISAHGLQVRVERPTLRASAPNDAGGSARSAADGAPSSQAVACESVHELLDLSAGGIRFHSSVEYEPDEEVIVHFELPGSECFVLPARVVRTPDGPKTRAMKNSVAVAFSGIDEATRSQLLRWVYREQVRRHRDEQRHREDR
ncbi:MAG: PilZ domain-containing protein [Myxococcota bacterium]